MTAHDNTATHAHVCLMRGGWLPAASAYAFPHKAALQRKQHQAVGTAVLHETRQNHCTAAAQLQLFSYCTVGERRRGGSELYTGTQGDELPGAQWEGPGASARCALCQCITCYSPSKGSVAGAGVAFVTSAAAPCVARPSWKRLGTVSWGVANASPGARSGQRMGRANGDGGCACMRRVYVRTHALRRLCTLSCEARTAETAAQSGPRQPSKTYMGRL